MSQTLRMRRNVRDRLCRFAVVQRFARAGADGGWLSRRVLAKVVPIGIHTLKTPLGRQYRYVVGEDDFLARHLVWNQGWEASSLLVASHLLRNSEGGLFLDIGSYTGVWSLIVATDTSCKTVAFEPNSNIRANLRANIAANSLEVRVQVEACALGSVNSHALLHIPDDPTSASLVDNPSGDETLERVVVRSIDSFEFVDRVQAMKIDVEGFEMDVIRGGERTIKRDLPHVVVELLNASSFDAVRNLLAKWGYVRVEHITKSGPLPVEGFAYEPYHSNFLFRSPRGG